jgi:hypothetical protein
MISEMYLKNEYTLYAVIKHKVKRSSTEKMMAKVEEELKRKGFDNL